MWPYVVGAFIADTRGCVDSLCSGVSMGNPYLNLTLTFRFRIQLQKIIGSNADLIITAISYERTRFCRGTIEIRVPSGEGRLY